jgi:hypothetical protein
MKPFSQWVPGAVLLLLAGSPLFAGIQADPECLQQCSYDYNDCTVNDGGCASFGECDRCQNTYNGCVNNCPLICIDPKSVRQIDNTYTTVSWAGSEGCFSESGSRHYYYLNAHTVHHSQFTRTEYCDGHHEDSTPVTWTDSHYCWDWTAATCYPSSGPAPVPACF